MSPQVSFRQLQVFASVARLGTVSAAAEALSLSPSSTSQALADLERQLGVALFERPGRRLVLNELGRGLLPRAEALLDDMAGFVAAAREPEGELRGTLDVSASATVGTYLLPGLVGRFSEAHPRADLRLRLRNTHEVVGDVLRLEADLGLIEGECREPALVSEPWCEDRLVVVAAPGHPLASRGDLEDGDLAEAPWILREPGSGTREVFEQAMRDLGLTPRVRISLGQHEAIKQAVLAGLGLGCLSALSVAGERERGELVALDSRLVLCRTFSLVWHPERYRSPLWQAFKVFLVESRGDG
ncbi:MULTISPECIES: LysR substrate-binding domain-containing protein [Halomonas]|uniref:Transcriptional regulator n=1 Tax=Halomonas halophila TaxID=29573 RepID=A0ABQ0U0J0_9GAMM|nr:MULTISPECIES: LysR substrate-binding domain-containing protein [Halomonas]MDR5888687.1 LysR substrate-binding domain-containing protein [Halomonas salina]RAH37670.1 LysR family transcriptional regulator [Halomonas sp. SL1]WJY07867.1 LysR substrate-binding domain-containing protein [Halomonas halophila]GEK71951.1 transcriptional regulator [Halomonas halophila]